VVQLTELLGTGLVAIAYFGSFVAVLLLFLAHRQKELLLSLIGFCIAESGRLFRVFGPDFSMETRDSLLRLTSDSSLMVFLGKTLLMPLGMVIAMLGLLYFAWNHYKHR
jgi:hypothetical protein